MRLRLTGEQWNAVRGHMDHPYERAAFLFARASTTPLLRRTNLVVDDLWLLGDADYDITSAQEIKLHGDLRPRVIAHAHALDYAVIEAHSHWSPGRGTRFSEYDLSNLAEFAPHMLWRLPNRPYVALVLGRDSFDSLAWRSRADVEVLRALEVDGRTLRPTGASLQRYKTVAEV